MGITAKELLKKQPAENRKYTMDFTNVLGTGTLNGLSSISHEFSDGTTSDLSITASGIDSTLKKVEMFIAGGTTGHRYRIEILVTDSQGQTLEGDGILQVRDK